MQIDQSTFQVAYRFHKWTSMDDANAHVLYFCAQTTINYGYDYFITGNKEDLGAMSGIGVQVGRVIVGGGQKRNEGIIMIKMFKGSKPESIFNAYDAKEVIKYLGPRME